MTTRLYLANRINNGRQYQILVDQHGDPLPGQVRVVTRFEPGCLGVAHVSFHIADSAHCVHLGDPADEVSVFIDDRVKAAKDDINPMVREAKQRLGLAA